MIQCNTHTHTGIQCVGVNWDKYKLENLQDIALCVGGRVLANIFGLFAEDYKGWGSGMPDLLLWKPQGKKTVIDEQVMRLRLANFRTLRIVLYLIRTQG